MDMSTLKSRQNEACAVARAMSENYSATTVIDTIVCLDGCEVIGAYLAQELTKVGVLSQNAHKTIYIVSPEYNSAGQIIFRENNTSMIKGKNVLLILDSATTGQSIGNAAAAINYYGGIVVGVSAIFSAASKLQNMPIHTLFSTADVPDYHSYPPTSCELCHSGVPIDAIANGYGYSRVK
jgi:orotate phosphoribosyltransferase